MHSISQYLSDDHNRIDEFFADADAAAACSEWHQCMAAFTAGQQALLKHIQAEENVLFPACEAASGRHTGPTQVMRLEHQQLRDILTRMQQAATDWNNDEYLSLSGALHQVLIQHNHKEETILYPMADQFLADRQELIIATMQKLAAVA